MTDDIRNEMIKSTNEMVSAPSCNPETKAIAEKWLKAAGTDEEDTATKEYIDALKLCVAPIDRMISFYKSERGKAFLGENQQAEIEKALKQQAAGVKFCTCGACTAALKVIEIATK